MEEQALISIVSPIYRAENTIEELVYLLKKHLIKITPNFEIILVNDASPDNSWTKIENECSKDFRVKGINLSRNFGQHYAITAGLDYAEGDWIVVMDCDLQDRPEGIINLYNKALEGYDSVFAQRLNRQDHLFKKMNSRMFYALFSYLTDTKQDATVANFGIYNRKVIDAILNMKDQIRYFPTMVQWVGFRKYYMPVEHNARQVGGSNYDFRSLFRLATNNIIAFSDKPLRLTAKAGFTLAALSFIVALFYFLLYFIGYIKVLGFTTLILSLWFIGGLITMLLGVLGLYIGKIFDKVKHRPYYIIESKCNYQE
ncbi:MAG: glycosyltransferase family 2 protein [Bacteroidales bacterium]|nr:glycosyltransferase family 2 protein [Bacteroidales bacterium]